MPEGAEIDFPAARFQRLAREPFEERRQRPGVLEDEPVAVPRPLGQARQGNRQLAPRDARFDGLFFVAVTTTSPP